MEYVWTENSILAAFSIMVLINSKFLNLILYVEIHFSGNSQLVKMLLERNADFTAADSNGATALHYVAQSNYCETVKVFLSFDKVNDIPDNEGRTALMWAAGKG